MEVVMFVFYTLGGILLYLTPTIVAANGRRPNTGVIAAINILTGWTFLGWVVAFIWSLAAVPKTRAILRVAVFSVTHPREEITMKFTFRIVLLISIAASWCDVARAGTNAPEFLDGRHPTDGEAANPPAALVGDDECRLETGPPRTRLVVSDCLGTKNLFDDVRQHGCRRRGSQGPLHARFKRRQVPAGNERPSLQGLLPRPLERQGAVGAGGPSRHSTEPHHIKNSLASETPATDGERVYALFGNLGMFCYDVDGKLLWKYAIPARNTQFGWGTAMSPILHGDRVYIANDNEEDSWLVALDKRTGK